MSSAIGHRIGTRFAGFVAAARRIKLRTRWRVLVRSGIRNSDPGLAVVAAPPTAAFRLSHRGLRPAALQPGARGPAARGIWRRRALPGQPAAAQIGTSDRMAGAGGVESRLFETRINPKTPV